MVGESQDWWYNDQKQFAAGFENWNAPESDWNTVNGIETTAGTSFPSLPAIGNNGLFTTQNKPPSFNQAMRTGGMMPYTANTTIGNVNGQDGYHRQSQISPQQAYAAYKQANMHRQMSWSERDLM